MYIRSGLLLSALALSGCKDKEGDTAAPAATGTEYSIDGIRWICVNDFVEFEAFSEPIGASGMTVDLVDRADPDRYEQHPLILIEIDEMRDEETWSLTLATVDDTANVVAGQSTMFDCTQAAWEQWWTAKWTVIGSDGEADDCTVVGAEPEAFSSCD